MARALDLLWQFVCALELACETNVSAQVYDAAVEAAKLGSGAGPHRLGTDGSWAWLLQQLALQYGVRVTYAGLASVRWITAKPERLIPTEDCLTLLVTELGPLHRAATTMMVQVRSYAVLLASR